LRRSAHAARSDLTRRRGTAMATKEHPRPTERRSMFQLRRGCDHPQLSMVRRKPAGQPYAKEFRVHSALDLLRRKGAHGELTSARDSRAVPARGLYDRPRDWTIEARASDGAIGSRPLVGQGVAVGTSCSLRRWPCRRGSASSRACAESGVFESPPC
jgi:hypothetical protein